MTDHLAAPRIDDIEAAEPQPRLWRPSTPQARGAVLVLFGPGDAAAHYERFGTRISFDGYIVQAAAVAARSVDDVVAGWGEFDALVESESELRIPRIVIGGDTAAGLLATAVARGEIQPDGLVLAGAIAPGTPASEPADHEEEIGWRTACPVHSRVLRESIAPSRGDDAAIEPEWPDAAHPVAVPALILHGEHDRIAPIDPVREITAGWPRREFVTIANGNHEPLNDINHRSVAAEIVGFAERLRLDAKAGPILLRESVGRPSDDGHDAAELAASTGGSTR